MYANTDTVILPHGTGFVTLALKLLIYSSKPRVLGASRASLSNMMTQTPDFKDKANVSTSQDDKNI